MRRLPFATAASIFLLAALAFVATASVRRCQILALYSPAGHLQGLAAGRPGILLFFSEVPFGAEYGWTARHALMTPGEYELSVVAPLYDSCKRWQFLGLGLAHASIAPAPGENWNYSIVAIPYWLLLLPLLPLPLRAVRNQYVRRCRARGGRCLRCGYNLRQSPDRCPECGMPKSKMAARHVVRTARVFGGMGWSAITLVPEILVVAALALALRRGAAVDRGALSRAETMTMLDRQLDRFTVPPGTPAKDAFELLRRASGVSLDIDWPALTIPSYPSGSADLLTIPVDLRLRNVRVSEALDAILGQADMGDGHVAQFVPEGGGRVLVTVPSRFPVLCRIYDVSDVIASVEAFDAMDQDTRPGASSGGGAAELEQALDESVRTDDWVGNSGTRVHHQVGRWLIVCHDEYGQQDVRNFLSRMREKDAGWSLAADDDTSDRSGAAAALNAPVGPLNLENATLRESFDRLSERTGVNLVPYWDHPGLWREAKVRLRLDHASLGQALSILCVQVEDRQDGHVFRPVPRVRQNRIDILGATAPDPELTLRVYDLRPLIEEVREFRRAVPPETRGPAGSFAWLESQLPPSQLLEHLRLCLVQGVAVDTWAARGHADLLGGRLIVWQLPEVQAEIAAVLHKLRTGGRPASEPLIGQ